MNHRDPPFYPGEAISGRVVEINDRFAVINVRGWALPLEIKFIDWNFVRSPSDRFSVGDRVETVVHDGPLRADYYRKYWLSPKQIWHGYHLTRLPFLYNFWPELNNKYSEGSVVEVEFLDYTNWYIARVRMPEGFIVEVRTNDIHPRIKVPKFCWRLQPGEKFTMIIRKIYRTGGFWVQRYIGGTKVHQLAESGFFTPTVAREKIDAATKNSLRNRSD